MFWPRISTHTTLVEDIVGMYQGLRACELDSALIVKPRLRITLDFLQLHEIVECQEVQHSILRHPALALAALHGERLLVLAVQDE